MTFAVEVVVVLKPVVNDPQGLVVRDGLHRLGFPGVRAVRVGKYLELEVHGDDEATVRAQVEDMCAQLLRNPVIEDSRISSVRALTQRTRREGWGGHELRRARGRNAFAVPPLTLAGGGSPGCEMALLRSCPPHTFGGDLRRSVGRA